MTVVQLKSRRVISTALLLLCLWAGGNASYITLKAELAQCLLERAWSESAAGTRAIKPWSWADTWPVARLSLPTLDQELLVLSGASARNLAFGPAHLTRSGWLGDGRATMIAGHRDTHFSRLDELKPGDALTLERAGQRIRYRVSQTLVVHQDGAAELEDNDAESLLLVTCWPFEALNPGTEWRYVVRAVPQPI